MFGLGKKQPDQPQSRQQRRAADVRRADRAGQAWEDAGRRREYELARPTVRAPRAWWRSS
ncbi:hypothetical protein [Streptomyces sp. Y1]|uniref:Uncharacterized protein n=1 Tax=Streptomyces sp. Y1 TaxID=3238634 RepID=A0AB39TMK2_9ACTN